MAIQGSVTLNGVSDGEMVRIWEYKNRDGNKFVFHPNLMQPINLNNNPAQFTGRYNNVVFNWTDEIGLNIVHEILGYLLKKDEQQTKAANQ